MFSKTHHAYEAVRRQILDGTFQPGEPLRLSRIAKNLKLSEMPVREALRLLQKDGLVVMNLHRGAQVAELSFERAWEIEEVRLHLEVVGCRSAAPFHDAASLAVLRQRLETLRKDPDKPVLIARRNRDFHTAVIAKAPNSYLREHIEELWDRAWQYSSASFFDFMPDRIEEIPLENARIIALIESGDFPGLETFLNERLTRIAVAWTRAVRSKHATPSTAAPNGSHRT